MRPVRLLLLAGLVAGFGLAATEAKAVSPRNPYRSFNLSGINYGSMQWERAQRQGKQVWPYYNTPSGSSTRSGSAVIGGAGGAGVVTRSGPPQRRFRRR